MAYFLDACALIALANDEPGADHVLRVLTNHECFVHVINVYELMKDTKRRTESFESAELLLGDLEAEGLKRSHDMDPETLKAAADLRLARAQVQKKISVPDVLGLAASGRAGATFLTSDHAEMDDLLQLGMPIEFFR